MWVRQASLDHPNVVRLQDVIFAAAPGKPDEPPQLNMIMELCTGGDLFSSVVAQVSALFYLPLCVCVRERGHICVCG